MKLFRTTDFLTRDVFKMEPGEFFSTAKLRKGMEEMQKLYGEFGYIDFVPEPSFDFIPNSDKLDLTHQRRRRQAVLRAPDRFLGQHDHPRQGDPPRAAASTKATCSARACGS